MLYSHLKIILKRFTALLSTTAAIVGLSFIPLHIVHAAERTEITFNPAISSLQGLIDNAGSTPTRIILPAGATQLNDTLKIAAGADIEIIPNTSGSSLERGSANTAALISVAQGGALTVDNNGNGMLTIDTKGDTIASQSPIIETHGKLTINNGTITGGRNIAQYRTAAVAGYGSSASIVMNNGSITDNTRLSAPRLTASQWGAAGLIVSDGAQFTMNGGTITNNRAAVSATVFYTAAVAAIDGGIITINNGEISHNSGWAGGILGATSPATLAAAQAEKDTHRNYITINGGTIDSNTAGYSGGGVMSYGNTIVTMNGGTISNNTAPNGGGIGTQDEYVVGGFAGHEEPSTGKLAGVTPDEWADLMPAAFTMNGGSIINNAATSTGGGINVVSNRVHLTAGNIKNNTAKAHGGGMYVATVSYGAHLENVVVNNNTARYIGGGIWVCPTGSLDLHITDGSAIYDNTAKTFGDDLAHDNLGSIGALNLYLDNRIIGGADIEYHYDNRDARFDPDNPGEAQEYKNRPLGVEGLKTIILGSDTEVAQAKENAQSSAKLFIQNNTSYRGAGIGSNGKITIGKPETINIPVHKKWVSTDGSAIPADKLPSSIELQLMRTDANGTKIPVGIKHKVTPDKDGNWEYTFTDLPKTIDGEQVNYTVEETALGGAFGTPSITKNADGSFTITNPYTPPTPPIETTDITVEKKWVSADGSTAPADKIPDSIELQLIRIMQNGDKNPVGARVMVRPDERGHWTHTFTDLPKTVNGQAVTYTVEETPVSDFTAAVTVNRSGSIVVTNTYTPPTPPTPPTPSTPPQNPPTPHQPRHLAQTGVAIETLTAAVVGLVAAGALAVKRYKKTK